MDVTAIAALQRADATAGSRVFTVLGANGPIRRVLTLCGVDRPGLVTDEAPTTRAA